MKAFARFADDDPPAAVALERARALVARPPAPDWEPITALDGK
jgi:adenylate cyclase